MTRKLTEDQVYSYAAELILDAAQRVTRDDIATSVSDLLDGVEEIGDTDIDDVYSLIYDAVVRVSWNGDDVVYANENFDDDENDSDDESENAALTLTESDNENDESES